MPVTHISTPSASGRRAEPVIEVILNPHSGSGTGQSARQEVEALFRSAGQKVKISSPAPRDLARQVQEMTADPAAVIVAGGGDGTVSSVAAALADTGRTLGVLPLGTLNHFAKDVGIPLKLEDAVATIIRGRVIEVDVGEVNGRVFINNSSLGLYPHIVSSRDAQQQRLGRGKWPAFFWAFLRALHRYPYLNLRITLENEVIVRRTPFLFVGNNEYELKGFNLGGRTSLQGGYLGLYVTRGTTRLGLFRLFLHALFGRIDQARDFDATQVQEAWVETHRPEILVSADGEVMRMKTPLHYRTRPRALRVQVPLEEKTS